MYLIEIKRIKIKSIDWPVSIIQQEPNKDNINRVKNTPVNL